MWELYDEIINELPSNIYPSRIYQNGHLTVIDINGQVGATVTNSQTNFKPLIKGYSEKNNGYILASKSVYLKYSWRELGALIKSWNFKEASIGAAAINAFYNQDKNIADITNEYYINKKNNYNINVSKIIDPFDELAEIGKDKIITTIGHFGTKKPCFSTAKEVRILEMSAKKGDYPDSASEYLLSDADIVIITGFTFINKTLPRLLELSKNAKVLFIGPSCPLAPQLFKYGVDDIASSVFESFDEVKNRSKERTHKILVKVGSEVRVTKNEI